MHCWVELKSLRDQSVGEVSAGLQLVETLAMPLPNATPTHGYAI